MVRTFRADFDVLTVRLPYGPLTVAVLPGDPEVTGEPACRCWRCGKLLTVMSVVVEWQVGVGHRPSCRNCLHVR
jgi:hypothetical protein